MMLAAMALSIFKLFSKASFLNLGSRSGGQG